MTDDVTNKSDAPDAADAPDAPNAADAADAPDAPDAADAPDRARRAWRRLRSALRPHTTRGQLLGGALCALLGFAFVVTLGEADDESLDNLRQADLVRILDDVTQRSDRLDAEADELEATREELLSSSDRSEAARELAQERLDVLGVLTGTAPAVGPGIRVSLSGSEVDASTLLGVVQELRDAGAEAIQVDEVRVVASTAFVDSGDGLVEVDGTALDAPFVFRAIGDAATLEAAMSFPGGVVQTVTGDGGTARVEQVETVTIDALRSPEEPEYARPARTAEPPASP